MGAYRIHGRPSFLPNSAEDTIYIHQSISNALTSADKFLNMGKVW